MGSAQDALSDDIVGRLAETVTGGLDLLDRLQRSGIGRALPAIAQLVENGDLDRLVHMARVVGSAHDALSDDIVSRLAETATGGLDLLDRVQRSGVDRALPAIAQLVETGDLDRLVHLARVIGSAQDALSDDIVARLAGVVSETVCLLDRITRSEGVQRLLNVLERDELVNFIDRCANNKGLMRMTELLEREEMQSALTDLLESLCDAKRQTAEAPAPKGGIGGLLRIAKDPQTQEALQFVSAVGSRMRAR